MTGQAHPGLVDRGIDRRRRPTPMVCRHTFVGRRVGFRREGEAVNTYVDRPGAAFLWIFIAILSLCLLDAVLTLAHVRNGGGELNPIMRVAIGYGTAAFVTLKCGLTAFALLFLGLHRFFRHVQTILLAIFAMYVTLSCYHVYLALVR